MKPCFRGIKIYSRRKITIKARTNFLLIFNQPPGFGQSVYFSVFPAMNYENGTKNTINKGLRDQTINLLLCE